MGSPLHIAVDPTVSPVHAPTRRIPVAKLDRVNIELNSLCDEGIIRPVTPLPQIRVISLTRYFMPRGFFQNLQSMLDGIRLPKSRDSSLGKGEGASGWDMLL